MKLSIIVPVYGVEKYIEQCISSLLVPDCNDYEIIIVNDGTKDKSIDIVRENFNDPRIRIIEQENAGLSAARNHGIREAKGEYIWCFDSDDWAESNLIPRLISILNGVDVIYMPLYYLNYEDNGVQRLAGKSHETVTPIELFKQGFECPAQFYIYKKSVVVLHELAFYEGILHEDTLFTPLALYNVASVTCLPVPLYHYRQRSGSITNIVKPKRVYDLIFVLRTLIDYGDSNVAPDVRYVWGRNIAKNINNLLYTAQLLDDYEAKEAVRKLVNRNWSAIKYLFHSGANNRIMACLSYLCFGNLWQVYRILYKFRY